MTKVAILGGGVAGLSAAHELVERGFEVEVYEKRNILGGKARSVDVPNTSIDGSESLPGEHGFRFFPRFYKHIIDTMERIPYKRKTVANNLVQTKRIYVGVADKKPVIALARFPRSITDLKLLIRDSHQAPEFQLTKEDMEFFSERIWQIMTSCEERRLMEYEKMNWWDFCHADERSDSYKYFCAEGSTRSLVAARAKKASVKTMGDIGIQLLIDLLKPGMGFDRVLNGPTNEVWIDPWAKYLERKGVKFHLNCETKHIDCKNRKIEKIVIHKDDKDSDIKADYYICAIPVEAIAKILSTDMIKTDPTLSGIKELSNDVEWMNGIQFYLNKEIKIAEGHGIHFGTPWSLTTISQHQFWPDFDITKCYNGKVKGILSVDISEWDVPGIIYGKPAKELSKEQIMKEVWEQLKTTINTEKEILKDEYIETWFLDRDIVIHGKGTRNEEPLLVNNANTWYLRPEAHTKIPNLFLASDYVKTYTDLATMEGANEAARRAVNCIIDASGNTSHYCKIWKLHEPDILAVFREVDRKRYEKGLPWNGELPFFSRVKHILLSPRK